MGLLAHAIVLIRIDVVGWKVGPFKERFVVKDSLPRASKICRPVEQPKTESEESIIRIRRRGFVGNFGELRRCLARDACS